MNDKDKEAFNSWLNPRDYHFDMDGDCWLNLEIVSIFSEMESAWLAAIAYERAKSRKLLEALEFYAQTDNWRNPTHPRGNIFNQLDSEEGRDVGQFFKGKALIAGQRARVALAEYKKEGGE